MFNLFSFINFVTQLNINKIMSTRQINSNTHQYAATFQIASFFYVSIYIALCLTDSQWSVSLKVLEGNIIRHKILRMLKFHHIIAFMKTYPNFKTIFCLGFFGLNIFLQLYFKLAFKFKCYCQKQCSI